ncbi:hypothetical protein A1O3_06062 [Capronia epimyces CBS 606.96]|uniref:Aminoglycoside phosphotransferase domain-containing protein n=1 Tax=Capronia epimyces CBS 606.96 TaxID=1182542 RepID=W9YIX7_9EURO|nr:uncharacterized protein A1O3_06062 [Capronia epimyces CBS 606.96]EXJ82249.1 hypothetical protein A1O3_06062 [Capronia epimyces CBS 606.96]
MDHPPPEQPHPRGPRDSSALFNARVLERVQNAFAEDPTVDLKSWFPMDYSSRLQKQKIYEQKDNSTVDIPFPLAQSVLLLLELAGHDADAVVSKIKRVIQRVKVLWQSEFAPDHAVIKCNRRIVLKVIRATSDYTEYTSMRFLQENHPEVPAPRPLGVISDSRHTYIFMSFIPGVSLDRVWDYLSDEKKIFIRRQLDTILTKMRVPITLPLPLGGTAGEGCRHTRRYTHRSKTQLYSCPQFVDFLLSNPHYASKPYVRLFRKLWKSQESSIVFTHGDLRLSNIMVRAVYTDPEEMPRVSGIVDWEESGLYPDWWEAAKVTRSVTPDDADEMDWISYLPRSISPRLFPIAWLAERAWGTVNAI